jgi:hypothetical protein
MIFASAENARKAMEKTTATMMDNDFLLINTS